MKKRMIFLLIVGVLFINISFAQSENLGFESSEYITPPEPPDITETQNNYQVFLKLVDFNTKEIVGDTHVRIEIHDIESNTVRKTIKYVDETGVLKFIIAKGDYNIILMVDIISTPGKDYYFKYNMDISTDRNETAYLFPVGGLDGIVKDQNGDVITNANVKYSCGKDYGDLEDSMTDQYGSFSNLWLPIGECMIYTVSEDYTGHLKVEIEPGLIQNVEIVLDMAIKRNKVSYIIPITLLLIILILIIYNRMRDKSVKEDRSKDSKPKVKTNSRITDILKTLNESEQSIVTFLVENGNKSTQSNLRLVLKIPRTTLSRLLDNLEKKNIVNLERLGKLKKVYLSDWVNGKE